MLFFEEYIKKVKINKYTHIYCVDFIREGVVQLDKVAVLKGDVLDLIICI